MHETSLMSEIIQAAQNTAKDQAIHKVTSIELIISILQLGEETLSLFLHT